MFHSFHAAFHVFVSVADFLAVETCKEHNKKGMLKHNDN